MWVAAVSRKKPAISLKWQDQHRYIVHQEQLWEGANVLSIGTETLGDFEQL